MNILKREFGTSRRLVSAFPSAAFLAQAVFKWCDTSLYAPVSSLTCSS